MEKGKTEKNPVVKKKEMIQAGRRVQQEPMVPGIGIAGQVMCPFSLMAPKMCLKQGCEMWVELNYGEIKVARCSLAWTTILLTEIRIEIEKLRKGIKK